MMISRRDFLATAAVMQAQDDMFRNAEAYERFMGRWSRLVAPLLIDFADVPRSGHVLDVGSGTGSLAVALAEHGPSVRVTGIDPSEGYVRYAASRNRFGDRVSFETGDAQRLRFPDRTFNACLSLLVFNFIPDAAKALSELRRVTQPGGRIAAAVWDYGGHMEMLRAFWDAVVELDPKADKLDEKHMPLCRSGQLSKLWKDGGLRDVVEKPITIQMKFASFGDYWEPFLLGQGPAGAYVRSLASDSGLRNAVKRRLGVTSEDRPLTLTGQVWAVRGTT